MAESLKHLKAALNKSGLRTSAISVVKIGDDYGTNLATMTHALIEQSGSDPLVANITGGMKPQALALAEATRRAGGEAVYYDGATQQLATLTATGGAVRLPQSLVTVDLWLAAQGQEKATITSQSTNTETLVERAVALAALLREIQWVEMKPLHTVIATPGKPLKLPIASNLLNDKLHALLVQQGVLKQSRDGQWQLKFANVAERAFYGGTWLEYWVLHAMRSLGHQNAMTGVHLKVDETDNDENELDVAALDQNQLVVIECKAGGIKAGEVQVWLNKLAAVGRRVGSKMSKKILVTLTDVKAKAHLSIARKEGISIIAGDTVLDLAQLTAGLRSAMANAHNAQQ